MIKHLLYGVAILALCSPLRAEHWRAAALDADPPECTTPEQCKQIDEWYAAVVMNHVQTSCCGKADAYWADKEKISKDGNGNDVYNVIITDKREIPGRTMRDGQVVQIPADRIDNKHQGNPTGHTIVFVGSNATYPYCFFPMNFY